MDVGAITPPLFVGLGEAREADGVLRTPRRAQQDARKLLSIRRRATRTCRFQKGFEDIAQFCETAPQGPGLDDIEGTC